MSIYKAPAVVTIIAFLMAGCATQITEEPSKVTRATTNLSEFSRVILVKTEIAPTYADQGPNIKAVNKIDEILQQRIGGVLDNVEFKTRDELAAMKLSPNSDVLVIKPYVKQIKFIGGAARFWAGAMAGSSVVIMDVSFERGQGGKYMSNPGFIRKAGAYTDAFGVASNRMLEDVAQDAINYISYNK
jgi:hypothetical protein